MEKTYVFIPKYKSELSILTVTVFFNDKLCEGSAKQLIDNIYIENPHFPGKAEDYDISHAIQTYFTPN
jgi:hypothetical protein